MKTFEGYLQADYSPENWIVLLNTKAEGDANIDNATSVEDVMTALENAQAAMAAIHTLLDDAKAAAHASLNAVFAVNPQSDYSPDNWTIFSECKAAGDKAIEAASDLGEVEAAQSAATAEMGGVQTMAQTLAAAKSAARDALTAAFENYHESDYTVNAWVELNEYKSAGDSAIEAASDLAVVEMAQAAAAAGMDGVQTIAQTLAATKLAAHEALAAAFGTPQSNEPVDPPALPETEATGDSEPYVVAETEVAAEPEVTAESEVAAESEVIAGSEQIEDLSEVDLLTIETEAKTADADTVIDIVTASQEMPLTDSAPIVAEELNAMIQTQD